MDPLTALGVVGNVLQIAQIGTSVVSAALRIYKFPSGALRENIDAASTAACLKHLADSLNAYLCGESLTCLNEDEQALGDVCNRCVATI